MQQEVPLSRPGATGASIDAITVSVVQHRLHAIVEEMGEAMLRTAYSQILNSSRDFSTGICDATGRLVAQAEHVPVHVGALPFGARSIAEAFAGDIHPGDVFLLNDPYFGGNHLPDVTVFVPVFEDGRLAWWSINRAHMSDIGGSTHGAYNPGATEIFQEGLRIPPLRIYDKGAPREDLLRMIATNVRHPRDFRGDLAAMIGSARLCEKRMLALIAELGPGRLGPAVEAMLDGAERRARAIVAEWKDGVYCGEACLDDDGRGRNDVAIRAKVTVRGSDVEVDLTQSDAQAASFVNSSHANMQSAVAMAFAYLIDADIPKNDGSFRPLTVKARPGTIVWAEDGAPVTMCTSHCSNEIVEAIVVALSGACPERAMGGWGRRFRIAIKGEDPRTGRTFIWHLFQARPGGGGSVAGDGYSSVGEWHSAGGIKFGSIEVAEARFPFLFLHHEYRIDSAGDGQFRGGTGADLEMVLETTKPAVANTAGDGIRHGARGMLGGTDGVPHHYVLKRATGEEIVLGTKTVGIEVWPGDRLLVHSGGGGGWGDPARRSPEARRRDVENGLVSPAAAAAPDHR
ncbi:MAG: hydantoinase B/oxoprolinase family protein [Hyphomicrobiaceae bacterium]|nr:hydantoinase B/oxoprolinase family protein [Hyphomicrobiaceae bacterium]